MIKTVLKVNGMMCGMCEAHMNYYQSFYNKLIFHFSSKIKEVLA